MPSDRKRLDSSQCPAPLYLVQSKCGSLLSLDEGRRRAAESIRHLLEWGFLVAGDLASDGLLVPWGTTPADSVVRIEGLWRKLPGLTPVDVAWFRQTLDVASSKKCDR